MKNRSPNKKPSPGARILACPARKWNGLREPWKWLLVGIAPGAAIGGVYVVPAIGTSGGESLGYWITAAGVGALIPLGLFIMSNREQNF